MRRRRRRRRLMMMMVMMMMMMMMTLMTTTMLGHRAMVTCVLEDQLLGTVVECREELPGGRPGTFIFRKLNAGRRYDDDDHDHVHDDDDESARGRRAYLVYAQSV
jgi:hypothetical protein